MRGWTVTIVMIVCAVVVIALFQFLFKNQMDKKVQGLKEENAQLEQQLTQIAQMEKEIEPMALQIPYWKQKVGVYRAAVPSQIDDNIFFNSLRQEMQAAGVRLMTIKVDPGGPWLGDIKEEDSKKLEGIGIDVDAARELKVAFYSVELVGPYAKTLEVLENLKKHGRMYSIDEVMGPAGSGGGTVTKIVDSTSTPIQVTGKIFYGIDEDYVSTDKLNKVFAKIVLSPIASKASTSIKSTASGWAKAASKE
jgi:hypothetical protein